MKVHIVRPNEDAIEGFDKVEVSMFGLNLDQYSNNEVQEIFANDLIDSIKFSDIANTIGLLVSKMRKNGRVVVGGTDLRMVAKMVINGSMPEQQANVLIEKSKSMTSCSGIADVLRQHGLKILASYINGVHYEIEAQRA